MADKASPKQPRSALEKLVYQSLLKVENILLELKETATTVEPSSDKAKCNEPIQIDSSQILLTRSPTQKSSSDSSIQKSREGIMVDVNVNVINSAEKKTMKMSIECPDFKPKRILFNGQWLKVRPAIN